MTLRKGLRPCEADNFGTNFDQVVPKAVPKVVRLEYNTLISLYFFEIGGVILVPRRCLVPRAGASFYAKSLKLRLIELPRSYQGAKNGLRFGLRWWLFGDFNRVWGLSQSRGTQHPFL